MIITISYVPQKITLRTIKRRAFAAYNAGTLTAQAGERSDRLCHYERNGCRCAIGAALTRDTLKCIDSLNLNAVSVATLIRKGVIVCSNNDLPGIIDIQAAYDRWVQYARHNGQNSYYARKTRKEFLKLIQT